MKREIKSYVIAFNIIVILVGFMLVPIPQAQGSKFVLAYTYPTDGTGLSNIGIYINGNDTSQIIYSTNSGIQNTSFSISPTITNITLGVSLWLNGTKTGVGSLSAGRNIIWLYLSVSVINKTIIFEKQNMTYYTGSDVEAPLYWYSYVDELDIMPLEMGQIYTLTITYSVYYPEV